MTYLYPQKVLFKHCDPAGIVFYPRYFEMINDCVEAFFEDVLEFPFHAIHKTSAVPTAEITTRFTAPSKMGDHLVIKLDVAKLGRSSIHLRLQAVCGIETRFEASATLVFVNEVGRPAHWPEAVRTRIVRSMEGGQ